MRILDAWQNLSPPALFVASFASLIGIGTLGLLYLPGLYTGSGLSFLDALFTATSAVCVTGLIVVDTATYFTFWGQLWILILFQLGGIGLLGMTSVIIGSMGRRLSLRTEMMAVSSLQERHGQDFVKLAWALVLFVFLFEGLFALYLWLQWRGAFGDLTAAWHAIFHAVSAFCNAGFSTFTDSLMGAAHRPEIILPISLLIIIGGFGFLSSSEIWRWLKGRKTEPVRLSAHTYAAVIVTLFLLVGGTIFFAVMEWRGVLDGMSIPDRIANAWFMSTTARTAGFNTIDYGLISNQSAFITIALMFVGGSPGSTAGGIKTTALAVLLAMAWAGMRGRRFIEIHARAVPEATVARTVSLAFLFFIVITMAVFFLSFTEAPTGELAHDRGAILPLVFEVASATGTVGLSMGATPNLTPIGRLITIVCMFVGRVGPLAFFAALSVKTGKFPAGYRPASEDMIVG